MSRVLARLARGWRLVAIAALIGALSLGAASAALAGPLIPIPPIPITPVFPPWWSSGWYTASQPATITGLVTDAGGVPLAGVLVQISGDTSSTSLQAQSFMQSAVTTSDGTFVITDVIQGTYQMLVNDPLSTPTVPAYAETYPWYDATWRGGANTLHWVQGGHTVNAGTIQLKRSCMVHGNAYRSVNPVAGSQVTAHIVDGDVEYARWATTGADGSYEITSAPPGDWTLTFSGSGVNVPSDPAPGNNDNDPKVVTKSQDHTFSMTPNTTSLQNESFVLGQEVFCNNTEYIYGTSFQVGNIGVTATSGGGDVYSWTTNDRAQADVYLPAGEYDFAYNDPLGVYQDYTTSFTAVSGGSQINQTVSMTPAAGSYPVWGYLHESGTGNNVQCWISAEAINPDSAWTDYLRRVPSNGTGDGRYMIRLPASTAYAGNQIKLTAYDLLADWDPYAPTTPTHTSSTFNVTSASTGQHDLTMQVGGRISGTVHDELGNPVRGVQVGAHKLGFDPAWGGMAWTQEDRWWTVTDSSGNYTIGGLPANTDYKVNFTSYYDEGLPLPKKYGDYYRRTWHGRPLADSLNTSATPVTVDHDPVAVTLANTTPNIDETITPGGYVVLHADGPEYPTGAVYCDVMYQVGGSWVEIDSGFTTGGTFHKDWKVMPTGAYRVDYSDYFGRGSGSWAFSLGAGDHAYTSVLVPAPIEFLSPMSSTIPLSGAFNGFINGGLIDGGTGGGKLQVQELSAMPPGTAAPSAGLIPVGSIYEFSSTGADFDGTWSLRLPYDKGVPDNLTGNLRVVHAPGDGSLQTLVPFTSNPSEHSLQIQTPSLSPFRVMFVKTKPAVGRPSVPSKLKRYRRFNVTGTLSPQHTAGGKSVQLLVYKYSRGKWRKYQTVWTKNYNYRTITQYRGSLKLGKGSYRVYAYAPDDTWHYSVKSTYRAFKIR